MRSLNWTVFISYKDGRETERNGMNTIAANRLIEQAKLDDNVTAIAVQAAFVK